MQLDFDNQNIDMDERREVFYYNLNERPGQIYDYRYRKVSSEISFSASGINPFGVAIRKVRKLTGGPKLIFVWPKKSSPFERVKSFLLPTVRGLLMGLIVLNAMHLWPGEFLPNCLPSVKPPILPPVKCNVIEPLWSDNS